VKKIEGPTAKSIRVSVIEEDAENLYSMRFILQSLGYEVRSFGLDSGSLRAIIDFAPEIVLVDMMMSGGVGMEILKQLKRDELKAARVVAVTAEAVLISEEELRRAGADDVLVKPYNITELQEKLNP
jgi:CheY-like chemotaxis protein